MTSKRFEFGQLEFKKHPSDLGGVQAVLHFDNGYGISVIKATFSYGDKKGPYELAVLKHGQLCYDTPITDDVLGYLTKEHVEQTAERVKAL